MRRMANAATSGEIFDVVDELDRVIGSAQRSEVHRCKLRHRAVHVLLFNARAELFVQKRSAIKDTFPRCFDSSASGHVNSGEDYDICAQRETQEELGLMVPVGQFSRHFKVEACEQTGWEFVWVYSMVTDEIPRINLDELEAGEFWTPEHTRTLLMAHPQQFAPGFVLVFNEFDHRGLFPLKP
jgi:16S rRNA (adenine1518-N6/adenine1519-N6)-dimethyltransferase